MKTLKIVAITFVATAIITTAFSVRALYILPGTKATDEIPVPEVTAEKHEVIETVKESNLTPTELRFRAIEARLSALEEKNNENR